jgi:hypothetical protein
VVAATLPDGPMQGPLGTRPGVEAVVPEVPAPMVSEPQILAVLWTCCRIGSNATIAAVKFHPSVRIEGEIRMFDCEKSSGVDITSQNYCIAVAPLGLPGFAPPAIQKFSRKAAQ